MCCGELSLTTWAEQRGHTHMGATLTDLYAVGLRRDHLEQANDCHGTDRDKPHKRDLWCVCVCVDMESPLATPIWICCRADRGPGDSGRSRKGASNPGLASLSPPTRCDGQGGKHGTLNGSRVSSAGWESRQDRHAASSTSSIGSRISILEPATWPKLFPCVHVVLASVANRIFEGGAMRSNGFKEGRKGHGDRLKSLLKERHDQA